MLLKGNWGDARPETADARTGKLTCNCSIASRLQSCPQKYCPNLSPTAICMIRKRNLYFRPRSSYTLAYPFHLAIRKYTCLRPRQSRMSEMSAKVSNVYRQSKGRKTETPLVKKGTGGQVGFRQADQIPTESLQERTLLVFDLTNKWGPCHGRAPRCLKFAQLSKSAQAIVCVSTVTLSICRSDGRRLQVLIYHSRKLHSSQISLILTGSRAMVRLQSPRRAIG